MIFKLEVARIKKKINVSAVVASPYSTSECMYRHKSFRQLLRLRMDGSNFFVYQRICIKIPPRY